MARRSPQPGASSRAERPVRGRGPCEKTLNAATASGFKPRPAFIEFATTLITTVGSPLNWSMLGDSARGSTTEGEHILGDMVVRARALGVETPILDLTRTRPRSPRSGRRRS